MRSFSLALALSLALLPSVALAHSNPSSGEPPINGNISAGPNSVSLTFNSPVVPGHTALRVLDEFGTALEHGPTMVAANGTAASVPTAPLMTGVYTVVWGNQSAEDGHENQGYYVFVVGQPSAARRVTFASGTSDQSGDSTVSQRDGDITIGLRTPTIGLGPKPIDVTLRDAAGQPVDKAFVRLRVDFANTALKVPEDYVVAQPTQNSPGHYRAVVPIGLVGDWTFKLAISRDGKPDINATESLTASAASSAIPSPAARASSLVSGSSPVATAALEPVPPPGTAKPTANSTTSQPGSNRGTLPVIPLIAGLVVVVAAGAVVMGVARRTRGTGS